jgi:hypothetical protein
VIYDVVRGVYSRLGKLVQALSVQTRYFDSVGQVLVSGMQQLQLRIRFARSATASKADTLTANAGKDARMMVNAIQEICHIGRFARKQNLDVRFPVNLGLLPLH